MAKPHEDRGTMPGTRAPARTPKVLFLSLGVIGWREGSGLTAVMGQVQSRPSTATSAGQKQRRAGEGERPQRQQVKRMSDVQLQAPLPTTEGRFQPKPNCIVINQLAIKAATGELGGAVAGLACSIRLTTATWGTSHWTSPEESQVWVPARPSPICRPAFTTVQEVALAI